MKEQSTSKGFAILSLAGILAKLLSLLYVPLLQGIIGTGGYGIYQKTYEVFTFLYAVLNLGMQTAIAKYISELSAVENHRDAQRTFRLARTLLLLFGTGITLVLIASAKFIAQKSGNPDIFIGLITLAPAIALTSVLCAYRGYFQGRRLMGPLAVSQVVEQFMNVAVSLLFAFIFVKYGVEKGSAGGTVGTSLGAFIAIVYLIYIAAVERIDKQVINKDKDIKRIRTKTIIKKLVTYGFPIALSAGLQNFGALVDMFNVTARLSYAGFTKDQGNVLYGILGYYKTLLYVPLTIITALATAVMPAIVRALVAKDKKSMKESILFAIRISYDIAIPAAFGLAILSAEIYKVLFGKTTGYELMVYGSVVVIFMAIVQIQNTILQAVNKFYFVVGSLCVGIVLKIASNYILIGYRDINVKGAVVGGILCFFVPMVLNHRKMCKTLKFKFSLLKVASKPILSSLAMTAVIFVLKISVFGIMNTYLGEGRIVNSIILFIAIVCGGIVYLYTMISIGGITKAEIDSMSPKVSRLLPRFLKRRLR
ncbi:putative polysaccharide biosynthesis protein [Clostridium fungisolvens]|uniref:Lipid II flippase MurJ n=1 Tax=Clostridium fungisolvens TaxID=1604897 RepID=A0A6V8SEL9_9CLOT|nr:polysaccharide biosynthesis protein [Clostridium fungisolvens]GFP75002.1 lipid II flippase MurJ [Clostridium fungisolvens]